MSIYTPGAFQAAQPLVDERQQARVGLCLPVFVLQAGAERISAQLIDVSEQGCKIAINSTLKAGKYLGIEVPAFSRFSGWVVWQTRQNFGMDFVTSISRAEVEYIVSLAYRSS